MLKCSPGLYLVNWSGGDSSLASIGLMFDGRRWIAPSNWTSPGDLLDQYVDSIDKLTCLSDGFLMTFRQMKEDLCFLLEQYEELYKEHQIMYTKLEIMAGLNKILEKSPNERLFDGTGFPTVFKNLETSDSPLNTLDPGDIPRPQEELDLAQSGLIMSGPPDVKVTIVDNGAPQDAVCAGCEFYGPITVIHGNCNIPGSILSSTKSSFPACGAFKERE